MGKVVLSTVGSMFVSILLRRALPKRRYERKAPTRAWSHIRPLLKDAAQIKDALIRPVILWGVNVKERAVAVLLPGRAVSWGKTSICPPLARLYFYSC